MSEKLFKALKEGVVTVEFTKVDTGELRVMPCTLNQEIHNHSKKKIGAIKAQIKI